MELHDDDTLNIIFCGREYSPESRRSVSKEIDGAIKTEKYCHICEGLQNCRTNVQGWQVLFDEEASDMYGVPEFRHRRCQYFEQQLQEEKEKVLITPRFQQRSFETFQVTPENQDAYMEATRYAQDFRGDTTTGLMFAGTPGTGKTHLAASILRVIFRKGVPCSFIQVPRLLAEMRASYRDDGESATDNIVRTATRRFVVLDDIGAERLTDWVREQLYMIINDRYENMLPTVITTNCTVDELTKRLGEKTVDRIMEMCKTVPVLGQSWRRA